MNILDLGESFSQRLYANVLSRENKRLRRQRPIDDAPERFVVPPGTLLLAQFPNREAYLDARDTFEFPALSWMFMDHKDASKHQDLGTFLEVVRECASSNLTVIMTYAKPHTDETVGVSAFNVKK